MAEQTKISWADHTFNIVHGCTRVSPGCLNCYADTLSRRWGKELWGKDAPRQIMSEANWRLPHKWNRDAAHAHTPPRVFCGSMCDWAEPHPTTRSQVPRLWDTIRATPNLDWLLLTKRPEEIPAILPQDWGNGYPNVWLGTSVEDQKRANLRIPLLLQIPATIHFLSCEPLLGPVDLEEIVVSLPSCKWFFSCLDSDVSTDDDKDFNGRNIDWVICGGESGPRFRPMDIQWAQDLHNQCAAAQVPFWFKQTAGRQSGLNENALGTIIQQLPSAPPRPCPDKDLT